MATQNTNSGPDGSGAVGGLDNYARLGVQLGALQTVHLAQGTDLGDALTAVLVAQWPASFTGFIREVSHSNYSLAATATFIVYNATAAAAVTGTITPVTNAAARVTTLTTSAFTEGDVIQVRLTTSGGSGAMKGLNVWLLVESTDDSNSNSGFVVSQF